MSLKCRQIEDNNLIKRIRHDSYDSNIFCTEHWDAFLQNVFNACRHFIGIYDGQELIGVWPAYEIRKGPFKIIGSPLRGWFTPWLGPRFLEEIPEEEIKALSRNAMQAFDEYVAKKHFDYIESSSLYVDDETMLNLNYQPLTKATAILDISLPSDDLLKSFGKTCRKRIRRAEKLGCTVEDISSTDFVPKLWDMTLDVFARRGSAPLHTPKLIKGLIEAHLPSGRIFCLGVFRNDKLICIGVHAYNGEYLVDLFRATYVKYYKYFPYHILYWKLFQIAIKKGVRYFDMMGIDPAKPDQFKMSFHPRLIKWKHWSKSQSFFTQASKSFYEFYLNKIVRNLRWLGIRK